MHFGRMLQAFVLAGCLSPAVCWAQVTASTTVVIDASVLTLSDAYQAALRYDAPYLAATKELEAARQGVPLARAALLPQVGFTASSSNITGNREFGNALNQTVKVPLNYDSPQVSLTLRTPIFNYEAMSRFRQATSLAEGAEALLAARHIDLVNRLTSAYLQVLVQYEVVVAATEEQRALATQAQSARQRFALGEGTLQESATGEAAAVLAQSRLVQAKEDLAVARRGLKRITGLEIESLRAAPVDFLGLELPMQNLQDWLDQAMSSSPLVRFRQLMVDAATQGIERQRAGHLPRLDFFASASRSTNESISTIDQTTSQRAVGLQLAVPIFSGGAVQAGMTQSIAERDRTAQDLRGEAENLALEVERLYRAASGGRERLTAHLQALQSTAVAVRASTRALETGLGTATDLRDALFSQARARRELIQARYEYLNQRAQLLVVSGSPVVPMLDELTRSLSVDALMKDLP